LRRSALSSETTDVERVHSAPPAVVHTIAETRSASADGMRACACGASSLAKPQKVTPVYHASIAA